VLPPPDTAAVQRLRKPMPSCTGTAAQYPLCSDAAVPPVPSSFAALLQNSKTDIFDKLLQIVFS